MKKIIATSNAPAAMNAVYAEFFTEGQYPARSAVEVGALPRGALVEIETICVK